MKTKNQFDETPSRFVPKRGLAYTEVAALKDDIARWINDGFSIVSIWKLLTDKKKISSYTYRTFIRAVYKMIPECSDKIVLRPTTGRGKKAADTNRGNENKQFQTVSNTKLV